MSFRGRGGRGGRRAAAGLFIAGSDGTFWRSSPPPTALSQCGHQVTFGHQNVDRCQVSKVELRMLSQGPASSEGNFDSDR